MQDFKLHTAMQAEFKQKTQLPGMMEQKSGKSCEKILLRE